MDDHQYEPWMDEVEAVDYVALDPARAATEDRLFMGLGKPIRVGWNLWAHSLKALVGHLLPIAFLLAIVLLLAAPRFMDAVAEYEAPDVDTVEVQAQDAEAPTAEESAPKPEDPFDQIPWPTLIVLGLLLVFGFALTGVVLSQRYRGRAEELPYFLTFRRVVPWAATEVLVLGIPLAVFFGVAFLGDRVGFLLGGIFIVLGAVIYAIFLSLRLFWADEFALVHGSSPLRALKQSWRLTRNAARPIFSFQFILGVLAYPVILAAFLLFFLAGLPLSALENLGAGWIADLAILTLGFMMLFLTYAAMHAPELAYFYGVRAARSILQPDETAGSGWLEAAKKRAIEPA
jgi:hypothetical protein